MNAITDDKEMVGLNFKAMQVIQKFRERL